MEKRKAQTIDQTEGKTNSRIDLLDIKLKLSEALGENGKDYWNTFCLFILGKISVAEFEKFAKSKLAGTNATIHNNLVLGILKNARAKELPPSGVNSGGFEFGNKFNSDGIANEFVVQYEAVQLDDGSQKIVGVKRPNTTKIESEQWKNLKQMIKSMTKNEKKAIKYLLVKQNESCESFIDQAIKIFERVSIPVPQAKLPSTYMLDVARGVTAPLCFDTKSTPDMKSLQSRMICSAFQHGLVGGVTDESVELLLYGLDCHLKNIVSNMIYKNRSNRALGIPVKTTKIQTSGKTINNFPQSAQQQHFLRASERIYQSKNTLHLSDILFSLEVSPFVSIETPACLERGYTMLGLQETNERYMEHEKDLAPIFHKNNTSKTSYAFEKGSNNKTDDSNATNQIETFRKFNRKRLKTQYENRFGKFVDISTNYNGPDL
ncbi:hypothetical protein BB559_001445 [Furculomyces boomerangus]|uniref:Uncharacterized protein n=1 Tax=Furculomyces boomerangus TaxID=61424 RepID=A0A2T9Z1W3_9FUNG|nr:hypothetical protein BB559_001445 [Furculomyces boomerangus]